ncbi:YkyB family protein [Sporosarcina sp. FA9]|uniref:YkyB family protein n=1 Tax=Sporosarcina sp. FA9 TaxID=3413030 RepID=UPI003F6560B3
MGKPHFVGWNRVGEGYYTKTTLNTEFGLKPLDESENDATLMAMTPAGWKKFNLFHINNTIEIKRRKVRELEINNLNIAEALYTINKSAKISRDTKTESYSKGEHSVVKRSKTRQEKLYQLKDSVIRKLLNEDKAKVSGFHKQKSQWNEKYHYLILIEFEGFSFHLPATEVDNLKELGEIQIISAEKTRSVNIKFFESVNLLEKFIQQEEVEQIGKIFERLEAYLTASTIKDVAV